MMSLYGGWCLCCAQLLYVDMTSSKLFELVCGHADSRNMAPSPGRADKHVDYSQMQFQIICLM